MAAMGCRAKEALELEGLGVLVLVLGFGTLKSEGL